MSWSSQFYALDLENGEVVVSDGKVAMVSQPGKEVRIRYGRN